jgi:ADP-dependent NAD(P)H-hydrate dehydratase / NAD(P)H-hydrate epimerase
VTRPATTLPPVYTAAQIREIERAAAVDLDGAPLMERAGLAAAQLARTLLGERGRSVLVLAGPGNNGGDAFEVAAHLRDAFYRVDVVFAGDAAKLPTDAAAALGKWRARGGTTTAEPPHGRRWDLVVDGLYGIGLGRPLAGRDAVLVEHANRLGVPILALDIPSGITGDSGEVLGIAIRAAHTITFIALKPGLLTLDGPDYSGVVHCDPLGLDVAALLAAQGHWVEQPLAADWPAARPRNFHKGLAGAVGIVGGANGMVGAALLAGRAALHCGAGKVFVGLAADAAPAYDDAHPELMLRKAEALLGTTHLDAVAVGPGLGTDALAQRLVGQALRADAPLVIDADALNLIASYQVLQSALATRGAPSVVTPHPAEAARLLGVATAAVQSDRLRAARELARKLKAIAVLKGNGSITAAPDGRYWINGSGNSGMASGGMGDVLTGIVGALLAQGLEPETAARFGVWLHGAAADACVAAGAGPIGLTATETLPAARTLLNRCQAPISTIA